MNRLVSTNHALWQKLCSLNSMRDQVLARNSDKIIIGREDARDIVLKCLERAGFRRIIVGIGGFPASGKTTVAKLIVRDINDDSHATLAAHIPMDGFHFSNKRLVAEGREWIKGDITTYDVISYVEKLLDYKRSFGSRLFAPDYVREKHDVFEDRIEIGPEVRILVTEGIYVGHTAGEWGILRDLLDIVFYLDARPEQCADRIVSRSLDVGRSESMIERKLSNDLCFMEVSVQILQHADYLIRLLT